MDQQSEDSFDYKQYWEQTYAEGGNSGSGSYGVLAQFKADVIQAVLTAEQPQSVIEFGCGDGHQLGLIAYPHYLGLDVAGSSIRLCRDKFAYDVNKSFLLYQPEYFVNNGFLQADLVVCLDVLYHITDERDFTKTLSDIFASSRRYVILYTKITGAGEPDIVPTIKDRDILSYLKAYSDFSIVQIVEQKYKELSSASFIILKRTQQAD